MIKDGAIPAASHAHATYDRVSSVLSGASVFSDIVVTDGICTAVATRLLTLANLGYTGATDANNYTHPNHSGHVTSTGDGATVLTVAAITGQTELASGLAATDELLVNDGGVIKRMDAEVVGVYMDERVQTRAQAKSHSELGSRSTGQEDIEVGEYESYYLSIGGSCTIDLNTASHVGTGDKLLLGRLRVNLTANATVTVTSDVGAAIISGTAPDTSGDDAILLWEYIRTAGGTERLFAKWVNE